MLYIAFVKNKPRWQLGDVDLTAKSRQWWNEGEKAAGLRTVGFWGSLSSEAPDVIVTPPRHRSACLQSLLPALRSRRPPPTPSSAAIPARSSASPPSSTSAP